MWGRRERGQLRYCLGLWLLSRWMVVIFIERGLTRRGFGLGRQ